MITVLGKLEDTAIYHGLPGYNVLPETADWTVEMNRKWLDAALDRGDMLLLVSVPFTGHYREEVLHMLEYVRHED